MAERQMKAEKKSFEKKPKTAGSHGGSQLVKYDPINRQSSYYNTEMEIKNMTTFTLTDNAIARVVDLLQLALLTGTDVVDNLRTLRLTLDGDKLTISDADNDNFVAAVARLEERVLKMSQESETDQSYPGLL